MCHQSDREDGVHPTIYAGTHSSQVQVHKCSLIDIQAEWYVMDNEEVNKTKQLMTGLLCTVVQVVHCMKFPVGKGA